MQETGSFHPPVFTDHVREVRKPPSLPTGPLPSQADFEGARRIMESPEHPAMRCRPDPVCAGSHCRAPSKGANCPLFCLSFVGAPSDPGRCNMNPGNCEWLPHTHGDHLMEALVWNPEILFFLIVVKNT